eukprot:GEMP01091996.1.p1 GENE.GEMP01091996.1~~GEMP01091996.1.p1  ORF type:complete len:128 (+),score=33.83 GEMP01091996.1:125-508(+)
MMFVAAFLASCSAFVLHKFGTSLDINQKVYVENQLVLGEGAGEGALNQCNFFAPQHVDHPSRPTIKVCGTSIKLTAFVLGRCKSYHDKQWTVGSCDKGAPSDSCVSFSPDGDDARLGAAQSYIIEQC